MSAEDDKLYLQNAAEQGDGKAQTLLGIWYFSGQGGQKDYTKAAEWFGKAAEQGDVNAQSKLGLLYFTGQGVPEDKAKAAEWYGKAAKQGDARSQFYMGILSQDDAEAAEWYGKAAEQGDADAQYELGLLYQEGKGVPQHYIEAAKWFEKAGVQGNEKAREPFTKTLIQILINNANMKLAEANELLKYALAQGNTKPKDLLAIVEGAVKVEAEKAAVEKKAREAKEAFEKLRTAAEQGDADAQFKLGNSYFTGQGETRDHTKAIEWFGKATAQGHTEAKDYLEMAKKDVAEKAKKEKLAKIGLVLQIGVTAAAFFIIFSVLHDFSLNNLGGGKELVIMILLLSGLPTIVIGIISLLFRKKTVFLSGAGMFLIALILIVLSISLAASEANDFWDFILFVILGLIGFAIPAIPGFIMTGSSEL